MAHSTIAPPAPLRGCLYCHTEGTTSLVATRRLLGLGADLPTVRCEHCQSLALLDYSPDDPDNWRIRYRRANDAPAYYYVALHLGSGAWLSAAEALAASTNGYVQRQRVQQTRAGNLAWLHPAPLDPAPEPLAGDELVYLALRAVTLQEAPPPGLLVQSGAFIDSGKLWVTDRALRLAGQRRAWSFGLREVEDLSYDAKAWTLVLGDPQQPKTLKAPNQDEQYDAQLVAAVVEQLCRRWY